MKITDKGKKNLKIWSIVLLVILVIVCIIYCILPKWSDISKSDTFDEEEIKIKTEEIIRLYSDDNFEAVVEYMNDDMRQVLNAATLKYSKSQNYEKFGDLESFGEMHASEAKQNNKMYAMVQVNVSYTNVSVTYTVTFDENMKLAGFYIK